MINPFTLLVPFARWLKLGSYIVVLLAGLYGGYKVTSNHYQAKEAKLLAAQLKEVASQDQLNREVIQAYQANFATLEGVYNKLKGKVYDKPLTNVPCSITADAARLWNDSLFAKESMPKDSSRVTTSGGAGATIEQLFNNAIINNEKAAKNRERLKAIKEWDRKTYGD